VGVELLNESSATTPKTDTEVFEENFPFYLAIGMSPTEYWTGDSTLVRYYRRAYLIKQENENNNAWLHGLYIYDAISTALSNALRCKGVSAKDYAKKPYDFKNRVKSEAEKQHEVDIEQQKAAAWMESLVRMNKKK
jgi:hypothetical protein